MEHFCSSYLRRGVAAVGVAAWTAVCGGRGASIMGVAAAAAAACAAAAAAVAGDVAAVPPATADGACAICMETGS